MKDVYTYANLFRPKDFENRPINTKVTAILKFDNQEGFLRDLLYISSYSDKHLNNSINERRVHMPTYLGAMILKIGP